MASAKKILKQILNVKDVVIERLELRCNADKIYNLNVHLRPHKRYQYRCSCCQRVCPVYDGLSNPETRSWRGLDIGGCLVHLVYPNCRVNCPEHGVKVCHVPWAFAGSRFTRAFDLQTAWLAKETNKSTVAQLQRIDWKTVGRCIDRVREALEPDPTKRFDGLKKIGIDETSFSTGHKYLTVVVNHETNSVVWAHEGHSQETLSKFFEQLTEKQRKEIEIVSADGARWIDACIKEYIPHAKRCMDRFHVIQWANEAMDQFRRNLYRQAKHKLNKLVKAYEKAKSQKIVTDQQVTEIENQTKEVLRMKGCKMALGKDPKNLTKRQESCLKTIEVCNPKLHRAYALKETLRLAFDADSVDEAARKLKAWRGWASRSRIPEMVELSQKIKRHETNILNTIETGLSNGKVEAINNKIQLIIRKSFGFRSVVNLINMILLVCSNLIIPLPNRPKKDSKVPDLLGAQCI